MPLPMDEERARAERRRRAVAADREQRLEARHAELAARIAAVRAAKAQHPVLSLDELDEILPPVPGVRQRIREARHPHNERR